VDQLNNIQLPKVIHDFIFESNEHNSEAMLACFTDNAVLNDNKRLFNGIAGIKGWSDNEYIGSRVQVETKGYSFNGKEHVVSTEINGDYPAGPYHFVFSFILLDDLIAKLRISDS
jgi:hypothetical protein